MSQACFMCLSVQRDVKVSLRTAEFLSKMCDTQNNLLNEKYSNFKSFQKKVKPTLYEILIEINNW